MGLVEGLGSEATMITLFSHILPSLCQQFPSYTFQLSGPGLKAATVNQKTHVLVQRKSFNCRPCPVPQNVTAKLELVSKSFFSPWFKHVALEISMTSPSRYEVTYTAVSRGQYKLHIQTNDREINGSPFIITVYPDPTQLDRPVRVVSDLSQPYGIAHTSRGEMIVSECWGNRISIFDTRGKKIRTFGSRGDSPNHMGCPAGIVVDDTDNIYVSSQHKLQKFTSSGELIKCIGKQGKREGEFIDPRGIALYGNQVYVCDRDNHRIQVFDLELKFLRSIGTLGNGRGEFNTPHDVKFDTAGNMYVAEYINNRVQVLDSSGHFIRAFGEEGEGKLSGPSGLHVADKYVYVADHNVDCILVYETSGKFVTVFGWRGQKEGQMFGPRCITSCVDGFIYVCDSDNKRVQIF